MIDSIFEFNIKYRITLKCSACGGNIYVETDELQDFIDTLSQKECWCSKFKRGVDALLPQGLIEIDRSGEETILMKDGEVLDKKIKEEYNKEVEKLKSDS